MHDHSVMEVLVAEDDLGTRRILEAALTKWGYPVRSYSNGRSALEELEKENAPRLAILDWLLPEMDGVEVCRRLQQSERTPPPYLILLTCMDRPEDIIAGLEAGADDYVVKPFKIDELQARIRVGRRVIELRAALTERDRLLGVAAMAGAVCHEMNQPLQIASMLAEHLLMDLHDPARLEEGIETLQRQVERMGKITQRIMTMTRFETTDYLSGAVIDISPDTVPGANTTLEHAVERREMIERKILVVDDEAEVRAAFQRTFERGGYTVRTAAGGDEALRILEGESIQVMFFDLVMPGMSGIELCCEIRKTSPMAVIHAVTGYASLLDASGSRDLGFDHYYVKPVKVEVLLAAADAAFAKVERWRNRRSPIAV